MASCEISKEQMLAVLGELEQFKAWEWTADEQAGVDAIRALIESSVKITTVGGGLFSHYPQGRAKQTEGSESSGERAAPPAKEGVSVGTVPYKCPAVGGNMTDPKPKEEKNG